MQVNGKRVPTELFLTTLYEQAHNGLYKNANSICGKHKGKLDCHVSKRKRDDFIGLSLGFAVFVVCFLNVSLFLKGAQHNDFPYFHITEILSAGGFFTRQTGFVYVVFFVVSFIKVCLLMQVAEAPFKGYRQGIRKTAIVTAIAFATVLSYVF
jgi:hypothetical protein